MPELFSVEDKVLHTRFGIGTVLICSGPTVVVRFAHGIEECVASDLEGIKGIEKRIADEAWDIPLEVINRVQAEAIRSVNDTWGAFSRSRIELLPHQLWVCRQVTRIWPTRWLIADDVGLGKTIEAGMILMSLLSRSQIKRLLILCPASLVEQWQARLREMFDIRLSIYTSEADRPRTDFWGLMTASLHLCRHYAPTRTAGIPDYSIATPGIYSSLMKRITLTPTSRPDTPSVIGSSGEWLMKAK